MSKIDIHIYADFAKIRAHWGYANSFVGISIEWGNLRTHELVALCDINLITSN